MGKRALNIQAEGTAGTLQGLEVAPGGPVEAAGRRQLDPEPRRVIWARPSKALQAPYRFGFSLQCNGSH